MAGKCEEVLKIGLTPEVCEDRRQKNRYRFCRGFQLMREQRLDQSQAIKASSAEIREKCPVMR